MHASIAAREAAGDELNMEGHDSEQPECLHLYVTVEPAVILFVSVTFPGRAVIPRHLVEDAIVLISLLNATHACHSLFYLHANDSNRLFNSRPR